MEGWAIRDLLWHLAVWSGDAARVLGEMAAGTWNGEDPSLEPGWTDAQNARQLERSRGMDPTVVTAAWRRERASMLEAFGALEEVGPDAAEWFEESGPGHYEEHLPSLEAWVREILGPGPTPP